MAWQRMMQTFIDRHVLPDDFNRVIKAYYQPLAHRLFNLFDSSNSPFFVGVNGCQGSGKSTLSAYIADYLSRVHALNVVVMSLQDFYFAKSEGDQLATQIQPMLKTRGVSGTHKTSLLSSVIAQLKEKKSNVVIPQFNKATDNPYPKTQWQCIDQPADIVILEGWCWGVPAQKQAQLSQPINALERNNDSEGIWRNYVNQQLASYYQPLYQCFDYWITLQAPTFDYVYQWRLEQEQKLAVSLAARKKATQDELMNAEQTRHFIQYFQRLTEHGIKTLPLFAETTFVLAKNRCIQSVQQADR